MTAFEKAPKIKIKLFVEKMYFVEKEREIILKQMEYFICLLVMGAVNLPPN